ncbi:MAG: hypothetical protein GYB65_23130 [Chloroflexi bacterium]|nr:hypothetical protein [Chloroflexota bacterium]
MWPKRIVIPAVLALCLALPGIPLAAQVDGVITVEGDCTLADAITAANTDSATGACPAGDGDDTIVLTADVVVSAPEDGITVRGNNYGDVGLPVITTAITIEGNGYAITRAPEADPFRLLAITGDGTLTLDSVTGSGGIGSGGTPRGMGGFLLSFGTVSIADSTFSGNETDDSGGAIANVGTLTISGSTFTDNVAAKDGGAVYIISGEVEIADTIFSANSAGEEGGAVANIKTLTISGCTFADNVAGMEGGALFSSGGNGVAIISDSTFRDNHADFKGGGISNHNQMTISASAIIDNTTPGGGGGVLNEQGVLAITDSTLVNNIGERGAGIDNVYYSELSLVNTTLILNEAELEGGGLINRENSTATITNCAFVGNVAGESGGGIQAGRTSVHLVNTIVAGNAGGDCANIDGEFTGNNNLAGDDSCVGAAVDPEIVAGLPDDLTEMGEDELLSFTLVVNSALDAGDPDACPETDQRGVPREDGCDIGAWESVDTTE